MSHNIGALLQPLLSVLIQLEGVSRASPGLTCISDASLTEDFSEEVQGTLPVRCLRLCQRRAERRGLLTQACPVQRCRAKDQELQQTSAGASLTGRDAAHAEAAARDQRSKLAAGGRC